MVTAVAAVTIPPSPDQSRATSGKLQLLAPRPIPKAPALVFKNLDPAQALQINQKIPYSIEPNPPAQAFRIGGDDLDYIRALECLTSTIYYEAANENADGQHAVAQVVLNRVRHPAFPKTVCAVTYDGSTRRTGCQFTFTCDGALRRVPHPALWARSRATAAAALEGEVFAPVGNATHYHASYVVPYWAMSLAKNASIGSHIFYRWPGWWGQSGAFKKQHLGGEPDPASLRHAALGGRGRPSGEELPLGTDPRAELISIIHLLGAAEQTNNKSKPYEQDVRIHFSAYFEHEAIRIYRQLQAENPRFGPETALSLLLHYSDPPKLEFRGAVSRDLITVVGEAEAYESFITAVRGFAAESDFDKFYSQQRPYYARLEKQARNATLRLLATVERNTEGAIPKFRLILAPLLRDLGASGCEPVTRTTSEQWILVAPPNQREKTFQDHAKLAKSLVELTVPTSRRASCAIAQLQSSRSSDADRK